jgi:protocatechuate 3,4-dioxygenase beta subunit
VATYKVSRETLPPDWPISMVLDEPARAEFLIRGPDGRTVAGARIQPRVLNRDPFGVPDGLAERIEAQAVSDEHGRAVLTAFFPEEISTLFVSAPGLGRQYFGFGFRHGQQEARTIELRPVGRVEGQIVADDPEIGRDRRLLVTVRDRRIGPPALGLFFVTTDPQGRFVLPEVPVGELNASGMPPVGSPWFLQSASGLKVEAGQTTRVEVKAVKGVRLKGTVRQRGTGAPIAGAKVYPYSTEGSDDAAVRTDPEGRFALFARSGAPPHIMVSPPEGFASLMYGLDLPKVPEGVAEFDLPPIELSRAGTVRGIVVDDRGEPVPGAAVMASWPVNEGPGREGKRETRAIAGRRGEFLVDRVNAEAPVDLSATAPDGRRTTRAIGSRAGTEPARLVLESSASASLAGRVVDTSGHRVAGARVHIRVQQRYPSGQVKGDALVEIRGAYVIRTNETGWYRTPPVLDPGLEYAALVEADEFEPARTPWVAGQARTFPELVLRPRARPGLAAYEGSVLDRSGRPVIGAAVWTTNESGTPIRTATDAGGRFRLSGIPPRPTFLFVEATGFRFQGRVIDPAAGPVSIALTGSDEPPSPLTTLPTARPRAEERALARRVLLPYAERVIKEGDESSRLRSLETLALSDPARVLEIIETGVFANPWFNDYLRRACAQALWEDSRAEALAVVEAMQAAEWRARGHLDACDAMPTAERKARVEQVDQALLQVRAIAEGDHRVQTLGQVAEHYLDLGEVEKGEKLLRETVAAARALPKQGWGGYARGSFAEELSQVDPAAALELIEGVGDQPFLDRHRINLIKEVASRDPARAEALLATLKQPDTLARNLPALCYAMARKDPDRARRIADRDLGERPSVLAITFNRPYAIGMIALALADTDKPRATHVLGEAFDVLKAMAAEGRRGSQDVQDAASVAAALVPVAERIDPALVPEFFWRAASFRGSSKPQMRAATMPDTLLALLLARYDRDAAMVLLRPILDRGPTAEDVKMTSVVQALAAIDPPRAAALVESLPDDPDLGLNPFKNGKKSARLDLAAFLGRPPNRRWDRITGRLLHLWIVGNEDAF